MIRHLNNQELAHISGGSSTECSDADYCKISVLVMLELCDMSQLQQINGVLKSVVLDANLRNADEATIRTAMMIAIENASF